MKERTNYTGTNNTQTDSNIAYSNSIMSMENLVFKPVINDHSSTPSIVQNNSRKRLRKRTYKKKNQSEIAEPNNKVIFYIYLTQILISNYYIHIFRIVYIVYQFIHHLMNRIRYINVLN